MFKLSLIVSGLFFSCVTISQNTQPTTDRLEGKSLQEVEIKSTLRPVNKTNISTEATASPASVSLLGRDYIAKQAISSYGDFLRPLTGVYVSNYNLGGVGYGIQMRGYGVLDHARDIAFFIDGVPQNQGSSIQTNGYVDLRMLIPEDIRRFQVIRGPFSPFYGDHALGGVIAFETMDKLPSSLTIKGGSYGLIDGTAIVGFGKKINTGYVSLDAGRNDDYRGNNKEKHLNGLAKYTFSLGRGMASIRAQAYSSDFGSAGYLNRGKVDSAKISKTSYISPTDGGTTRQQNVVFNYKGSDTSSYFGITAYVQHHDFVRISTGTISGKQYQERDNRLWSGFDIRHTNITYWGGTNVLFATGVYFRMDAIVNTTFAADNGARSTEIGDKTINTYTPAAYAELQLQPAKIIKFTLGARYDLLYYDIRTSSKDEDFPNLKSKPHTDAFSPKVGVAVSLAKGINVFINAAQGFKAPSGNDEYVINSDLGVSKLTSYEIGVGGDDKTGLFHGLVSAYLSDQTKEVGENPLGEFTNFGKTRRTGIEAEIRAPLAIKGGVSLFANYTNVLAKIRNGEDGNTYVTNTPDYAATVGLDFNFQASNYTNNRFLLSVYSQFIGKKNLKTDGSVTSNPYQRLSGKFTFYRTNWGNFKLFAEATYYPGHSALDEVSFLSRGVLLVTAPQAPFTFNGGVRIPF